MFGIIKCIFSRSNLGDITTFLPHTDDKARDELIFTITNPVMPKPNEQIVTNKNTLTYNASERFCQRYKGTRCRQFLEDSFVFVQPPYSQEAIEAKVENSFLVISQSQ